MAEWVTAKKRIGEGLRITTQFLNNRIVNDWNKLADQTVNVQTKKGFKSQFDGEPQRVQQIPCMAKHTV